MSDLEEINRKKKREKERKQKLLDEEKWQKEEQQRRQHEIERIDAEREKAKKRRKNIQPAVMLLAGAIVSIAMLYKHYPLLRMLLVLVTVLIVFNILGDLLKWMFDRFAVQIEKREDEELKAEWEAIDIRHEEEFRLEMEEPLSVSEPEQEQVPERVQEEW